MPIGCYKMIYTGKEVKAPPAPADFRNLSTERNISVEFDESMWRLLVEKVVVKKDGFLKFVFYKRNGSRYITDRSIKVSTCISSLH